MSPKKKMRDPGGPLSFCKAFVATLGPFSLCPGRTKLAFLANAVAPRAPSPKRLKRKARPKVGISGRRPLLVVATKKGSSVAFKKGLGRMLNSKPEEKMPAKNLRAEMKMDL